MRSFPVTSFLQGRVFVVYPPKVCWMCNATKGNDGDLHLAYTNTAFNWMGTLYQDDPFDQPPVITTLIGWDIRMAHPDLLHCWHLGTGRDLLAGAIVELVKAGFFEGRNQELKLCRASRLLREFAKTHGHQLSRKKLNKACLNWASGEYPELKVKGADTAIIGMWLSDFVVNNDIGNPDLSTAIWTSNNVLTILAKSTGYFLTEREDQQVRLLGRIFCDSYLRLAHKALQEGKKLYRTRPKLHLVQHVFTMSTPACLNMHRYSTWMDEDANRKFMRINRATHRATAAQRVLERWMLGLPGTYEKLEKMKSSLAVCCCCRKCPLSKNPKITVLSSDLGPYTRGVVCLT